MSAAEAAQDPAPRPLDTNACWTAGDLADSEGWTCRLNDGEIAELNNYRVLHGRNAHEDDPDTGRVRWLKRLRLATKTLGPVNRPDSSSPRARPGNGRPAAPAPEPEEPAGTHSNNNWPRGCVLGRVAQ